MNFTLLIILIVVGYVVGSTVEKKHYQSIKDRERALGAQPVLSINKNIGLENNQIDKSAFATGSVVVSIDYFKRIVASLRNLVGGNVTSYESLVDRARREAVLRMKESAPGADLIVNLRIETSAIGNAANKKNAVGSVEALAYGTAIWKK